MTPASTRLDLRASEELRAIADNLVQAVAATAFASGALVYLLRETVGEPLGLIWLFVLNGVGAVRLIALHRFRSRTADDPLNRHIANLLAACALSSGLIWGASVWVLGAPQQHLQVVVMFACLAIATGGAFGTVASLRTAYAIFIPPIAASVVFGVLQEGRYYHSVGVMSLVYGLILARMIWVLNRQFLRQVALREHNTGLLEELRRRTAEAEAANEAKSRFLVAASHDLRQPMQVIVLRAQGLAEMPLSASARTAAQHLNDAVGTLHGLFDALLDVSRLDSGAVEMAVQPFALQTLFSRLEQNYAESMQHSAIEWRALPTDLWVASDPRQLERILRQLLDNAVRHAIRRSVMLSAYASGDDVVIEVRDTGPGIPHERQADIFKEFVQLDNPQRDRSRGLGLGLAIADRLARLLGHRIELESEPGRGSAFRVIVPRAATPALAAETAAPAPAPVPAEPLLLDDTLVALLDDTADVLHMMELTLQRWHCKTVAATQSDRLIEKLLQQGRHPDAVICDYRLAEPLNGIEVITKLRTALGLTCPAFLITGDVELKPDELAALGITLLQKPVRVDALRAAVRSAIPRDPRRTRTEAKAAS